MVADDCRHESRRRRGRRLAENGTGQPMSVSDIYPVLITRDAAATIERTLTSLREFPEVLVYDNGSTDGTLELCRGFANVRVVVGEFHGFGRTKNHAVSLAAGDWVLSIDADEYVSKELLESLRTLDLASPVRAYALERRNLFMGRRVEHAGWGDNWLVRLFDRRRCRFTDVSVHEKVLVPEGCATRRVKGPLWHQAIVNLDEFLQKISRYSELNRGPEHRVRSLLNIVLRTHWAFFKVFVLQRGFLEGWRGLTIATCEGLGSYFKHMKRYADRAGKTETWRLPE
jgi:glycosyltransferase involved in cell wall biosynthesis